MVEVFYNRMVQHASRIAALFQYFCSEAEVIDDYVESAIKLCSWYGSTYGVIFANYLEPDITDSERFEKKLHDWLVKAYSTDFLYPELNRGVYSFRQLQNYAGFKGKPDELRDAINALNARCIINVNYGKKGGLIILYPYNQQTTNPIVNIYGVPDSCQITPSFQYSNGQFSPGFTSFSPLQPVISHQEYNQPTVASNSVVNINSAVDSPDIENIQKELQEKANKHGLGGITIKSRFDRNNSQ